MKNIFLIKWIDSIYTISIYLLMFIFSLLNQSNFGIIPLLLGIFFERKFKEKYLNFYSTKFSICVIQNKVYLK